MVVGVFVGGLAGGVVRHLVGGEAVGFLQVLALLAAERFEVGVVVVGVVPDGAGGIGVCVNEELVAFFAVVLADPTVGEGARLILHGPAAVDGDAVAVVGARDL